MSKNNRFGSIVTPAGIAGFCNTDTPDTGEFATKKCPAGLYRAEVYLDPKGPGVAEFRQQMLDHENTYRKAEGLPLVTTPTGEGRPKPKDIENGVPENFVKYKASSYASVKGGGLKPPPPMKDAAGNDITGTSVWKGSTIRIQMSLVGYSAGFGAGITCYIERIQLLEARQTTPDLLDAQPEYIQGEDESFENAADEATPELPKVDVQDVC